MKTFAVGVLALVLGACASLNTPLSPTPVPGNPCGQAYVTCSTSPVSCCDENEACTSDGMCEDVGGTMGKKPHPQHPPAQ